jgi:anaerobic magnesium-protoporphyrin IX monomethyl ester cyclase
MQRTRTKPFVTFVRGPILSARNSINNEAVPYIPFAYIGAYIGKHGYQWTIVDGTAEGLNQVWPADAYPGFVCQGLTYDEIVGRIPKNTDVVAFGAMFSGEWPHTRDLINKVRERFPDALFVAGGEHVTALVEYVLRDCPALDVCVSGEGEHKFFELLESWRETGGYENVAGIGFIDGAGEFRQDGNLLRIRKIDELPWPHWPEGYLEKFWAEGKSYGIKSARDMPIIASRGCPYRCTFCSSPRMWTTRYILRDVDDLIAEIKLRIEQYDITSLQFYDLTAVTKKRWTVEFCNKLLENDIRLNWSLPSGTRSEALDDETLPLLQQTGCNYLVYGPESGSDETLAKIKKRISLEKLTHSIVTASKLGISTRANLIVGFPHEERRHIFQTILYGLRLVIRGVDEVPINIFNAYPGSELFEQLREDGDIVLSDDYFLSLHSLNADYTNLQPMNYNKYVGLRELALYRIIFMLLNYGLSYLLYPRRIFRTIRNLCTKSNAATVFEHRLIDALEKRKKGKQPARPAPKNAA